MNQHRLGWLWIPLLAVCLGCLPTLNPLSSKQDSFFDPGVLGVWVQRGTRASWSITHRGDRTYRVVCTDDSSRPGQFGQLTDIQQTLFLDLIPDESVRSENNFERIHLMPIHTIYRFELQPEALILYAIDSKLLKKYLAENADELPYVEWQDRQVVTASTAQLRAFVKEHAAMFSNRIELIREF